MVTVPKEVEEFSTTSVIPTLGSCFACDVLRRARQRSFVIRDTFSSYTLTRLVSDEQASTIKTALVETTAELKPPSGCSVRVDGAPSFQSLLQDSDLRSLGIAIDLGRLKNRNKKPVAEKAIQELERELKCAHPDGNPISQSQLALVTATLNMRLRNRGLSAREIVQQRDPHTGDQLNISDNLLGAAQHAKRLANHPSSALSQSPSGLAASPATLSIGTLIYVKRDGTKHTARDLYIVTSMGPPFLHARKLVGFQFRNRPYKLKYTEVYVAPSCHTIS